MNHMLPSDPTDILLLHDKWATDQLINACAGLSDQQFHQKFEIGLGSLHDTIVHMISAKRGWADLLAGRAFQPRLEGTHAIAQLQSLQHDVHSEFAQLAKAHPLADTVTRERDNKTYTFTRGAVLTHVTTHGMHHRAQCLNMLRHLGVPQPPSSVLQWMVAQS
jgi:uncharacterized damage-inducible protein DinB